MASTFFTRYEKARQVCAWFHLENWAIFRLAGPDTRDYLHRISTADINSCPPGEARQTLFLNRDGRLVADTVLICEAEELFYLVCPAACRENLERQIDHYLFTEKVTVEEVSSRYYTAALAGPASSQVVSQASELCNNARVYCRSYELNFAPSAQRTMMLIDLEGFQQVRSSIYEAVETGGSVIGDIDLYATLRIEEGCPHYGKDLTEKTIPLEANLKPAISFTKGCFPGQEIVARINNLGHPANVLVGMSLPETTEDLTGRELSAGGKVIGRITSICYSPAIKSSLALGYVKWNYREPGQVLDIPGNQPFQAVIVELPVPGVSG